MPRPIPVLPLRGTPGQREAGVRNCCGYRGDYPTMMQDAPILDAEVWDDLAGMLERSDLRALSARALDEVTQALEQPLDDAIAAVHKAAGGVAVLGAARLHQCLAALELRLKAGEMDDAVLAAGAARAALAATRGTMTERLG